MVMVLALSSCKKPVDHGGGVSGRALLDAVKLGQEEQVSYLLAEGVSTEVRDENGETPLLYGVRTGNAKMVELLLEEAADHQTRCASGKGVLELALNTGSQDMAILLLKKGVSPDELGHDGNPVLFKAMRLRYFSVIDLLFKSGADPNVTGKGGSSALHLAAERGMPECLTMLIKVGAKIEARDDQGATPIWYALNQAGETDVASSSCFMQLLEAGANPSVLGAKKVPLLCEAIRRGSRSNTLELINFGADVNSASREGDLTPLDLASSAGAADLVELLLSRGADPSHVFYRAIAKNDTVLTDLLLTAGLPLDAWDGGEQDSLIAQSVRKKSLAMLEVLLRHGADPGAKGREGELPLHMAIALREPQLVSMLLSYGHDPNQMFTKPASSEFLALAKKESMQWFLKNERRLTPLMMAANNGDLKIIRTLLNHGARKYIQSGRYRLYPLNFASRRSDVKAMQVMLGRDPENEKLHGVIDLSSQRVKIYNAKGDVVFSSRVSTGKAGHRTPTGTFVITDKHKSHNSTIYGSSMPYFQRFSCSAVGFHSGNCPGYPASHGCIRMPYSAAKKLFSLTPVGTRIVIQK